MPLIFIDVIANSKISFYLWLYNIALCVYIYHIFIHLCVCVYICMNIWFLIPKTHSHYTYMACPGGSVVKNPLAKQEMQVWSLDQEDPLEKEMATHSSVLAWEIPGTEEPGWL